jgi:hypothetical protein
VALATGALTTRATILDELELDDDEQKGARVERYINEASSLIAVILGDGKPRQLHSASVIEKVAGKRHSILILQHTPIVSITTIVVGEDTLDADEYEIHDAEAGFVHRIGDVWPSEMLVEDDIVGAVVAGSERKNITATYVAGWVTPAQSGTRTLPYAIERACIDMVVTLWRRRGKDLRVVAESYEHSSYTYGGVAIPAEVMGALAPFIRIANA